MSELSLEPFAAALDWRLDQAVPVAAWESLFARYFERLGALSAAYGDTVIGHIKGFAELPSEGFLQVSVVSPRLPASGMVQGNRSGTCDRLTLSLNILVYGLPYPEAKRIAEQAANEIITDGGGMVHFRILSDPSHTSHHHA